MQVRKFEYIEVIYLGFRTAGQMDLPEHFWLCKETLFLQYFWTKYIPQMPCKKMMQTANVNSNYC